MAFYGVWKLWVQKRGLGKGLSALIGDKPIVDTLLNDESIISHKEIRNIPIDIIIPKDGQPRKEFNEELLKELADSIAVHGVIQPIIVRKHEDKYEIIAGERRWRASKIAGLKEIPCIVRDIDMENAAKLALIENIQREDLNPIEEAMAYKRLMEEFDLKQEELGKALGKSRSYITNTIRLLNLDEKIIKYIYEGKLSSGHGKVLLGIKDKKEQLKVCQKIIDFDLNVRELESEVKKIKQKKKAKIRKANKEPYLADIEENLMSTLGTRVNVVTGTKGKIEIEYYGEDDLERIIDIIIS